MSPQSLRNDMHRAHIALDKMPPGSTVTDRYGWTWKLDRLGIYWETEHGDIYSSFQLAQMSPLKQGESSELR